MKLKICTVLLFSGVMFNALPAGAVSEQSNWTAFRTNNAGTTTIVTNAPIASTFCFLTRVNVEETDTGTESAQCQVRRTAVVWVLEATLGATSDADVRCSASCYNN
jgi:hypothetical protein